MECALQSPATKMRLLQSVQATMSAENGGTLVQQSQLEDLIRETLPVDEIVLCFGYGSGVFSQSLSVTDKRDQDNNLIDLIVVVRDSLEFHKQNYEQNPTHYWTPPSWMVYSSDLPRWFTDLQRQQESWFSKKGQNPGVYFNVTPRIKYGVVQTEDLMSDLKQWRFLYLAGRLQKPTLTLSQISSGSLSSTDNSDLNQQQRAILDAQNKKNLPSALSTALCILSDPSTNTYSCSEVQLYHSIAGLSYQGDYRMKVAAEDPKKIQRLVESSGQLERFQHLYRPILSALESQGNLQRNHDEFFWDKATIPLLQQKLPKSLDTNVPLEPQLAQRVAASARIQSVKGIVSAGPSKAMQYALRKLSKGLAFLKR